MNHNQLFLYKNSDSLSLFDGIAREPGDRQQVHKSRNNLTKKCVWRKNQMLYIRLVLVQFLSLEEKNQQPIDEY